MLPDDKHSAYRDAMYWDNNILYAVAPLPENSRTVDEDGSGPESRKRRLGMVRWKGELKHIEWLEKESCTQRHALLRTRVVSKRL